MHAFGASAKLAGRLRTAQQEDAEDGGLSAGEVEHFLQAMLVFGDAAVGTTRRSGQILVVQVVERLTHRRFVERHDRVAIVFLVAGVDQRVQGERIVIRRGDIFFCQGAKNSGFDAVQEDAHQELRTSVTD